MRSLESSQLAVSVYPTFSKRMQLLICNVSGDAIPSTTYLLSATYHTCIIVQRMMQVVVVALLKLRILATVAFTSHLMLIRFIFLT